eukprot:TRINITY_DN3670_c0_g1_i1.p1 TRINITY_DN3670_c0_g1~~TRINITY_DN3670_c0_g1_i1.p1  ORF type:complete len:306 (-),score=56.41 TRINITY_DN3670_c0_g1_i1:73-990(-)
MHFSRNLFSFSLLLIALLGTAACGKVVYVENDEIKLGVDDSRGCSIVYLSAANNDINVINTHDLGREVQASFYSGPSAYHQCTFMDRDWPWNPISSGDRFGNPSKVLSLSSNATSITCRIQPMQWACDNIPCNCEFVHTYTLKSAMVMGEVVLENHRQDKTKYGARDQELPAVYVNGFLSRLFGYNGTAPWTNGPLQEWSTGFDDGHWIPGALRLSEPWLAFLANNEWGVGVYNPNVSSFLGGFAGKHGSGGTSDPQTGYIAPISQWEIEAESVISYNYAIILGYIKDIRGHVYALHQNGFPGQG